MDSLPSRIRQFCKAFGHRIDTDKGQHFLVDQTVLDAIINAADIQPDDAIIEIGAGIGVLTKELIERTANVTTIEIDASLLPILQAYLQQKGGSGKMPTIINDNALHVDFPTVPYKIVANIPYHITSPLLRHAFLEGAHVPTSLTLLIQREVAEKICDENDRSLLGVIVALFGTPKIVCHVPPSAFLPPPKVDSAVLHIDCFAKPLADAQVMEEVFRLAKHAFSQKRKMLRNTMSDLPGGKEAMEKAGIDPTRRPQTLSVQEWIALAEMMSSPPPTGGRG